ncbi:MAG: ADP-ribosylglycohydrolase family protein [Candidatus Borkfalkiaceae bacterium]|nr:ADP-ribosylglycohydrolase family protein [Christensenellaceae bacterium]
MNADVKICDEKLLDKIYGCFYGKCLGGAAGAPFEGIKKILNIDDYKKVFRPDLPNDDLDLQLLWLDVLENKGFNLTSCNLADAWIEKCWYPFSEYGYFMKNYMRGIKPPYSGEINNSFFREGMGCPIRSEIWACLCAGIPELAVKYAYLDATLDHAENAVYAEQFLAAVESMAFYESDVKILIEKGLDFIPETSKLFRCIKGVLSDYERGKSVFETRNNALIRYGHPDFTNCVQNLAFVAVALLYGKCDMSDTISIALSCGYDTDCTCASAASIVGIIKGFSELGQDGKLIKDEFVCGINVVRPSNSIRALAGDVFNLHKKLLSENITDIKTEPFTKEGYKKSLEKIQPVIWRIYGPYFEQLEQPMNPDYPSPHGEGCVLPDLVCMVNNQAFLDKEYETSEKFADLYAKEDLIDLDSVITMEGQYAADLETIIVSNKDQTVWLVIGNNDGFKIEVNGLEVLKKDEIRLWTPYNNFCTANLKKGENAIKLRVLKRTEIFKFSLGLRTFKKGDHWHRAKWCTDLKFK